MKALGMLLPVIVMIVLGYTAKHRGWMTKEQNAGAKKLVFQILFPALIFHVVFTSDLRSSLLVQILYLDLAWILILALGYALLTRRGRFGRIAPYLLITCEGGNVALPLYISLVGSAHILNIVTFDVAGILINFGLVPLLVGRQIRREQEGAGKRSGTSGVGEMFGEHVLSFLKNLISSSFVLAVLFGLAANRLGLYGLLVSFGAQGVYDGVMSMLTAPIAAVILFTLGFDMELHLSMAGELLRLTAVRFACCAVIVGGFFLLFPDRMADSIFRTGVLLYFICPTGFPVPMQLAPLCKREEELSFMSAFLSLYLVITLAGYAILSVAGGS